MYGGVSHFSLRNRSSKEFTYETFQEGINYAHALGKKVYVTINSFPFNSQIKLYEEHIQKMAAMCPDAFIVSTPGVIEMCKAIAPNVPLHLSTQANVMNYMDAKSYHKMGVSRIIAAREVSLGDLKEIKKQLPDLEIEVFVHGSMCFSYSGRCLLSSLQTGRVPNRGSCANDCRFEYEMFAREKESGTLLRLEEFEEGTYVFNAKDLNLSAHIGELIECGVIDSLKIEGRTKSAYYAALTAKTYRQAIEDFYAGKYDAQKYQDELDKLANRGYNDGYLFNRPYEKHGTQELSVAEFRPAIQVCGEVSEDGKTFLCKHKIIPNEPLEIVMPPQTTLGKTDNEIGCIYSDKDKYYLKLYRITDIKEKNHDAVHSGYETPIVLPSALPAFSFLRKKAEDFENLTITKR